MSKQKIYRRAEDYKRFRYFRYLLLLLILFAVAGQTLYTRVKASSWNEALQVVVLPINADYSTTTADYIASLGDDDVAAMGEFLNAEASRYSVAGGAAFRVSLGPEIATRPPQLGRERSLFDNIYWSLAFRFWSLWNLWRHDIDGGDVTLFVQYYDPTVHKRLAHSLGLRKGMIGLVNAFAADKFRDSNQIVIAHELLHTLGASDKYDPRNNLPLYPDGLVRPDQQPRYPQQQAELMAGRRPLTASKAVIPRHFSEVAIGVWTAGEIGWLAAAKRDQS